MATASVIEKSVSPSPPPPIVHKTFTAQQPNSAANCPCKSCLSVTQFAKLEPDSMAVQAKGDEIINRKSTSDLEDIAYSIVMLIMEGRTPIPLNEADTPMTSAKDAATAETVTTSPVRAKRVATIKEGVHSKQLHERLMHKILSLNSSRSSTLPVSTPNASSNSGHSCWTRNHQVCSIIFTSLFINQKV